MGEYDFAPLRGTIKCFVFIFTFGGDNESRIPDKIHGGQMRVVSSLPVRQKSSRKLVRQAHGVARQVVPVLESVGQGLRK